MGQSRLKRGAQIGPNGAVIDSANTVSGNIKPFVGGSPSSFYNDSIIDLAALITVLNQQMATLQEQVSELSSASNDNTAPTYITGEVLSSAPGEWLITFSESLATTSNDSVLSSLALTEDGAAVTPDSFNIVDAVVTIYTPSVTGGTSLKISLIKPASAGLRDPSGNLVASFADSTVTVFNNSIYPIDYKAWYKFSGNMVDESGSYNGTQVGTFTYQGDTLLNFSDAAGTAAVNIGDLEFTDDWSVGFILDEIEDAAQTVQLLANNIGGTTEGFHVFATGNGSGNYYLRVDVGDGDNASFAQGPNTLVPGTKYNVHINFDVNGGTNKSYAVISIDGAVYNTTDSTINEGPIVTSGKNMYIGAYNNGTGGAKNGTLVDEVRFYNNTLSDAYIDSTNLHPYRLPFKATPATPGNNDTVFNTVVYQDWDNAVVAPYPTIDASSDLGGTVSSTGGAEIVSVGADLCLRLDAVAGKNAGDQFAVTYPSGLGDSIYLSWDMNVKDGFVIHPPGVTAGYGGKMGPSLAGRGALGEAIPTADNIRSKEDLTSTTGFTNRTAWKSDGSMRFYCYTPVNYQLDRNWDYDIPTPTDSSGFLIYDNTDWVNYTMRIVLNDFDDNNGVLNAYVDGVCVYSANNVVFRQNAGVDIDVVFFTLYNGGSIKKFIRDEYVDIDNFHIFDFHNDVKNDAANYPFVKDGRDANALGDTIPYKSER